MFAPTEIDSLAEKSVITSLSFADSNNFLQLPNAIVCSQKIIRITVFQYQIFHVSSLVVQRAMPRLNGTANSTSVCKCMNGSTSRCSKDMNVYGVCKCVNGSMKKIQARVCFNKKTVFNSNEY